MHMPSVLLRWNLDLPLLHSQELTADEQIHGGLVVRPQHVDQPPLVDHPIEKDQAVMGQAVPKQNPPDLPLSLDQLALWLCSTAIASSSA